MSLLVAKQGAGAMRRRRYAFLVAAAAVIGSAGAVVYGAVDNAPEKEAITMPGGTETVSPLASPVGTAVQSVLPGGSHVKSVQVVRAAGASYDLVDARSDGGDGLDVTVFHHFNADELVQAGLPEISVPEGHAWIGTTDSDLTSVYFLGADGRGIRVGSTSAAGKPLSTKSLTAIAFDVSTVLTKRGL